MMSPQFIRWFREIGLADVGLVGGKNASLGELYRELTTKGINVPNGFAVTAEAYREFLAVNGLGDRIRGLLADLDTRNLSDLADRGRRIRDAIEGTTLPEEIRRQIGEAYATLCVQYGNDTDTAVRSSATAEDLPTASFAGQQESYLNVQGHLRDVIYVEIEESRP
ncbi:MAG TPA: PEP/pyruvate-binding domain-containing protein [Fimbriiglobus sp.]|jgi:pyruvate,water dikinase